MSAKLITRLSVRRPPLQDDRPVDPELEAQDTMRTLSSLMMPVVMDGARKRFAGTKVHWLRDYTHVSALYRHLRRWENGELVDKDSGAHPLIHVAVRALMQAGREIMSHDGRDKEVD